MVLNDIRHSGGLKPAQGIGSQKIQPANTQPANVSESISVSDSAEFNRIAREDSRILDGARMVAEALPNIRQEKVKLAKERLESGYYDRPEVKDQIATGMTSDPESVPSAPISEEQIASIRSSVSNQYYDQPDVKNEVAKGLADDAING